MSAPGKRQEVKADGLWIGIGALVLGTFLLGAVTKPLGESASSSPSSFALPSNSNSELLAAAQLTAMVPTMTPYRDPTATWAPVIVVVTATPTESLNRLWCSDAEIGQVCSLPGKALPPEATAVLPSCEIVQLTPSPYIRECEKRDSVGANGRVATK
jgi:hypothetical protein